MYYRLWYVSHGRMVGYTVSAIIKFVLQIGVRVIVWRSQKAHLPDIGGVEQYKDGPVHFLWRDYIKIIYKYI